MDNNWISCKTKKPNKNDRVLVFSSYEGNESQHVAEYVASDIFWRGDDADIFHVTHWMPLPEPPKDVLNKP